MNVQGDAPAARAPVSQRIFALLALAAAALTVAIGLIGVFEHPFAITLSLVAAVLIVEGAILFVTSAGRRRWVGLALVVVGVVAWIWILIDGEASPYVIAMILTDALTTWLALLALHPRPYHPEATNAPSPSKPLIVMNRKSGGGKVERFNLDGKAREMGAEVVYLDPDMDLVGTLEQAVSEGADLLGAAGGDGTQALVAQVAARHDLPLVCIPAGTRNHFALDLGLDSDDPSLALDALGGEGEEIRVDLGRVADRPFVNNVSLGAYAEIVARPEYRDAKLQTALATLPEVTNPKARSGLTVEADGQDPIQDPQLVQIANNPYATTDDAASLGSRPRLDTGTLGVDIVSYSNSRELRSMIRNETGRGPAHALSHRSWTGRRIRVTSRDGTVPAGVDGEYIEFHSPLDISIRPGALRIRVPKDRPGPKTGWPRFDYRIAGRLWSILMGRNQDAC
jgi:diacylglycerol kinase family enzyme